jgi:DNA-binding beta-propeller fold protein YncE
MVKIPLRLAVWIKTMNPDINRWLRPPAFMRAALLLLLSAGLLLPQPAAASDGAQLTLVKKIPLTKVSGRIDHFTFDSKNNRLLVAALGNNTLEIIDAEKGLVVHEIAGFSHPQGVGFDPDSGRYIVANAMDGICRIFDAATLAETGRVDLKDDADNIRYDRAAKLLWVGYGDGGLAAIDPASGRQVADIKLEGHPESFQLEAKGSRIFINVPDEQEIIVADRRQNMVVARWALKETKANFPMALDEGHHRLFVGCRHPAKLVVLNTDNGAVVADVDIVHDSDDVYFDAARHCIYASGGGGFITVVLQKSPDSYAVTDEIPTAAGARTSFFATDKGLLFVAVPQRLMQPAEVRVYQVSSP